MLSVVIITKNEETNIQRTIDSCLKISPLEIIVVDSNSKDNTTKIVSENIKKNKQIKLISYDTPPFTAARGRHIGAQNISPSCSHILFLDGDMEIHPDFIAHGLDTLSSDPKLAIVMGQMSNHYYNDSGKLIKIENDFYDLSKHTIGGAMIISREVYDKSGGFNIELIVNEESELEYRVGVLGFYAKRIPPLMITHHTEAPRSKAQLRSRLLNKRITGMGINLYLGIIDKRYLKRFIATNKETFASLLFLLLLAAALMANLIWLSIFFTTIYLWYIKSKSGNLKLVANYCIYAAGMTIGFFLHLAKRRLP